MGFNSTIVILNDGLHDIAKDKDFGKKVSDAIRDHYSDRKGRHILYSGNGNVGEVVGQEHADYTQLIAVGGNCGSHLLTTMGYRHNDIAVQIRILEDLADKLGYKIIKKVPTVCRKHIPDVKPNSDSVYCKKCKTDLGWKCPVSSDKVCHYKNGQENCIFCGEPNERK